MKRLKFKTTSKKANFEVFTKLSCNNMIQLKGGSNEIPPEELEKEEDN